MSNQVPNSVGWRDESRYSPVQDRAGVKPDDELVFPPAAERVGQQPLPFGTSFLDEREVLRATYQGDDRCQLACPGCYTGDRLRVIPAEALAAGIRKTAAHEDFVAQVEGLGSGMQDLYLLGAEPTMDPEGSAAKLRYAREREWPHQTITHGAVSVERFEATFGEALDSGMVYMLVISLDSMVERIHNQLRGRPYAHRMTLATIRHCVQRAAPFKVQMTVWPVNYPTVLDSVAQLYDLGVRAFSFHCGSLDGVSDAAADREGLAHIDPLAWRALCEQLLHFRDEHRGELWHFNVPFLFFTEPELREHVIGEESLTGAYLEHVERIVRGEPSSKPVQACPALDVPQVYIYANDGPDHRGTASLCNIHNPEGADAYADFDAEEGRWRIRTDPATNQMQHMATSPHLCPALPHATRANSDRFLTEVGPLYHACRYIASNQMPRDRNPFGAKQYGDAVAYYAQVARALESYAAQAESADYPIARVRRITAGHISLRDRADALAADLLTLERASDAGGS